jgi:hypothetical protein
MKLDHLPLQTRDKIKEIEQRDPYRADSLRLSVAISDKTEAFNLSATFRFVPAATQRDPNATLLVSALTGGAVVTHSAQLQLD